MSDDEFDFLVFTYEDNCGKTHIEMAGKTVECSESRFRIRNRKLTQKEIDCIRNKTNHR